MGGLDRRAKMANGRQAETDLLDEDTNVVRLLEKIAVRDRREMLNLFPSLSALAVGLQWKSDLVGVDQVHWP